MKSEHVNDAWLAEKAVREYAMAKNTPFVESLQDKTAVLLDAAVS